MITNILLAALVSTQAVTLVAPAAPGAPAPTASAAAPQAPRTVEPRYCIIEATTGSRIPRKVCETRADWAAKGVTIP